MPLYEYECQNCHSRVERIEKTFDGPRLKVCPKCKGRMERLVSRPSIQFKGSGWYVTDYARKGSVAEKVEKELSSEKPSGGEKEKPKKTAKKTDKG